MTALARVVLLILHGLVAVTAVAGGVLMIVGALVPGSAISAITIPGDYLEGSPFGSFLLPGFLLAVVVGGLHAVAFVAQLRRARIAWFLSAAAAFDILIWIFVQMMFIPFSALQVAYFTIGLAEAGVVMVGLGLLVPARTAGESR